MYADIVHHLCVCTTLFFVFISEDVKCVFDAYGVWQRCKAIRAGKLGEAEQQAVIETFVRNLYTGNGDADNCH
jgi:hypothetical protein